MLARISRRGVADESGAILLLMAIALPVIVLLLAMSMDFGNWYVHKRQFENRVKAGALAAGVAYGTEFAKCASASTRPAAEAAIVSAAKQYAGAPNTTGAFNTAPGDATDQLSIAVNGGNNDPCFNHAADGAFPSPNGGYWTDVAAVAAEVPSFFSGFGVPKPKITASARVALMVPDSGMRPLVLANPAAATCVTALWNSGGANGSVPLNLSAGNWTGTAPAFPGAGTSDMTFSIRVGCPPNSRTYTNMAYVTRLPSGSGPALQALTIVPTTPGTCANNPYFIPQDSSPCQMTLTATFGASVNLARVRVGPAGNGFQNMSGAGTTWTLPFTINPEDGQGSNGTQPILIQAQTAASDPFTDKGNASVQAGTSTNQGPIADVTVASHAPPNAGPIGQIRVTLRSITSSATRFIDGGADCAPGASPTLETTFTDGCAGPFAISASAACTNSAGDNSPPSPAGPFDCVGGIGPGQLATLQSEYDDLWAQGSACTTNNWPNVSTRDPRLVSVFLTDGVPDPQDADDDYRITGFAAFYVTGWEGAPGSCGNEAPPASGPPAGSVWGHVVPNYVIPSSEGSASATPCTAGPVALCIATLVK